MNPKTRRNADSTAAGIEAMFRDKQPEHVPGYVSIEGAAEGLRGDDDAPFVKAPAFVTDPIVIADSLIVPVTGGGAAEYLALPEIQCELPRLLHVYLSYTMAVGGQLSLIPEVQAQGIWYVPALVDATVTPFVPSGTRFAAGGFGSRQLEGTELRTDVLLAGTANFALAFDVSSAAVFRLNVLDVTANAGNTLRMLYALAD